MLRFSRFTLNYSAQQIEAKLKASEVLKPVLQVAVADASAGCGSFFNISVVSPVFKGKTLIQQHRLVNEALKDEIKAIHGFTLTTSAEVAS